MPNDFAAVRVVVPARPEFVHILRAVTASAAARLDFAFDAIDDLRIAVDEASALLLTDTRAAATLQLIITPSVHGVDVVVSADGEVGEWPLPMAPESLTWQVLRALADGVEYERWQGKPAVRMSKRTHRADGPVSAGPVEA